MLIILVVGPRFRNARDDYALVAGVLIRLGDFSFVDLGKQRHAMGRVEKEFVAVMVCVGIAGLVLIFIANSFAIPGSALLF